MATIKNRGSVVLVMEEQYNWKTSPEAFWVFKHLYFNSSPKGLTVNKIAMNLVKSKSVVSRQLNAFKNTGFLQSEKVGLHKYFIISKRKLCEKVGTTDESVIWASLTAAKNFGEFLDNVKTLIELGGKPAVAHKDFKGFKEMDEVEYKKQLANKPRMKKVEEIRENNSLLVLWAVYVQLDSLTKENEALKAKLAKKH